MRSPLILPRASSSISDAVTVTVTLPSLHAIVALRTSALWSSKTCRTFMTMPGRAAKLIAKNAVLADVDTSTVELRWLCSVAGPLDASLAAFCASSAAMTSSRPLMYAIASSTILVLVACTTCWICFSRCYVERIHELLTLRVLTLGKRFGTIDCSMV